MKILGKKLFITYFILCNSYFQYILYQQAFFIHNFLYTMVIAPTNNKVTMTFKILITATLVSLLPIYTLSSWTQLSNQILSIPAYVYTVSCNNGQTVSGEVRWNGTADLDLFVYQPGSNLVNRGSALYQFVSASLNSREMFSFNVSATGNLYFRVQANVIPANSLSFTLQISVPSSPSNLVFNGYFLRSKPTMQATKLPNIPIYRPTSARTSITGTSLITPILTSTSSPTLYGISSNFSCLPPTFSNGEWNAFFEHSMTTPITSLTTYNMIFQVDELTMECTNLCEGNQRWDPQAGNCVSEDNNDNTSNDISTIAGIIAITLLAIIGFAIIVLGLFQRCKKPANVNQIIPKPTTNNSRTCFNTKQTSKHNDKQSCVICLQSKCDCVLQCSHKFHRNCIRSWQQKKQLCPMCRKQIKILRQEL